jgi:hypothetical protein
LISVDAGDVKQAVCQTGLARKEKYFEPAFVCHKTNGSIGLREYWLAAGMFTFC